MKPLPGGVAVHLACHARAQNMGAKSAELLRQVPETEVTIIERCSGHGGSWGIKTENFPVALKVGAPAAQRAADANAAFVVSECPLAGKHIVQGMERIEGAVDKLDSAQAFHPIELMARAYGETT
jgi:glycerol-3-phosphate dehydrogenase subunit C